MQSSSRRRQVRRTRPRGDRDGGLRSTSNDHRDVCNHSPARRRGCRHRRRVLPHDKCAYSPTNALPGTSAVFPHTAGLLAYLLFSLYPLKHFKLDTTGFLNRPLLQAQTLVPYLILFV
ncbi:hypothetical protein B0H14DRAFT_3032202, partial [Mycena olivaceomarginata]